MIKFDGDEVCDRIKVKRILNGLNIAFFSVILFEALILAALSKNAANNWGLYISLYVQLGVFVILYVIYLLTLFTQGGRRLNYAVCKEIANGLLAREDMFKGGGVIEFSADYSGDVLTLSRKNYTGAISIDPSRLTSADGLGGAGAKLELDLKPLKAVPALYATAGTKLWLFLQGYYALHGKDNGAESVTITDNMGKTPLTLTVFDKSVHATGAEKNYFIKKGLLK